MADAITYDLVIIGGGPAGYNAGIRAGQLGMKVAVIDKRETKTFGGTCLNVGCIPSKAMLNASEMFEAAKHEFAGLGIKVDPVLDLPTMLAQKDKSVVALTKGVEFLFKKNKVEGILGAGKIVGPGKVEVTSAEGEKRTLETKNILICTGSEPSKVPGVEVDQTRIVDSTGALSLQAVPKKMVVIGAGIIGLELGSVWRRLGAEVVVVEFLDRIIPGADTEIATAFQRSLAKQGMTFKLGMKVTGAKASKTGVSLSVEPRDGGAAETMEADVVLMAVGRRPYTEGLGLESVGVTPDQRGFIPNDHYKTTAEGVWVIGDVTYGPMLAHKAEDEAVAAVELMAGKAGHMNYDIIPSVIYSSPEVSWVGKTEDELKKDGVAYKAGKFPFMANARAKVNHETEGFVKVLADAATDKILGVHMMGPQVGEMIGEYCVAMEFGAASEDVARTCHPHPTRSESPPPSRHGRRGLDDAGLRPPGRLALRQPPAVGAHLAAQVGDGLRRGAVRGDAQPAGQRHHLQGLGRGDLFLDHQGRLLLGRRAPHGELHGAQADDRGGLHAQRPTVGRNCQPWIASALHRAARGLAEVGRMEILLTGLINALRRSMFTAAWLRSARRCEGCSTALIPLRRPPLAFAGRASPRLGPRRILRHPCRAGGRG